MSRVTIFRFHVHQWEIFVLSIENVWVIPLLKGEKITTRLSLKYAKLSVKLFYDHYKRCQTIL